MAELTTPSSQLKVNQQLGLSDGRQLGFAEYGTTDGLPLFYFHGWPSSRLEAGALQAIATEMNIRVVAPDRPGLCLSDLHPKRTLAGFCEDVQELARHLKWERFSVLGVSGGGPYAAACAARIRERVRTTLMVCSVGPSEAPEATKGMV